MDCWLEEGQWRLGGVRPALTTYSIEGRATCQRLLSWAQPHAACCGGGCFCVQCNQMNSVTSDLFMSALSSVVLIVEEVKLDKC